MEVTFSWGGVDFTVRPATIRSSIAHDLLMWALSETDAWQTDAVSNLTRFHFCNAVAQTTISGVLDAWQPPSDVANPEAVKVSYEAWCDLPDDLYALWIPAITQVNAPQVAPEYAPEPPEKKARK